ncbi:hypothetical protein KCTCHS21_25730 [Cohnella abietis]|uniref:Uncharacterized protein n=2 Tax=Cohnella abietis TaxID=2507935 RepID=A0A3T1D4Z9_9BACL|nr:hypothetical protein KCTCHS21_25730 [Cohnella abietis]
MEHWRKTKHYSDFSAWSDRMERLIARGIGILLILLILSQLVLQFPIVRHWLTTTDDAEGVRFHYRAH